MKKILLLLLLAVSLNVSAQKTVKAAPLKVNTPTSSPTNDNESTSSFVREVTDSVGHTMEHIRRKSEELMRYVRAEELTPQRRAVADSMAHTNNQLYEQASAYLCEQLESHRDSPDCAQLIVRFQRMLGLDYITEFLSTYAHADLPELKEIHEAIAINEKLKPGAELIDFELPDEVGTSHHLSEYIGHGNYVLLDFWASWCGPCRQETPHVVAAYERFHELGFEIVGISFDNNREAWLRAVTDLGMKWPQLSDLQGWKSLAAKMYNVHAIPFTLLFGPDGKVIASNLRGNQLTEKLEELLAKDK